jgi:plastocyanin
MRLKGIRFVVPGFVLLLAAFFLMAPKARAIPAFSRQYQTSCSTYDTDFPKLNDFGKAFKDAVLIMEKIMSSSYSHIAKTVLALLAGGVVAYGGSVSGKITGGKGAAVVYLEAPAGKTFPSPEKHIAVDQKSLLFHPHAMAVQVGTTVEFLNGDKVQHNIFWPSVAGNKKLSHNMGTWSKGEIRSFKFDAPGIVPLLCNLHAEMSGFIVVAPTPYYAEADASGAYQIDNVPDGRYTVTAWREGTKMQSNPLTVTGNARVDFTLTK